MQTPTPLSLSSNEPLSSQDFLKAIHGDMKTLEEMCTENIPLHVQNQAEVFLNQVTTAIMEAVRQEKDPHSKRTLLKDIRREIKNPELARIILDGALVAALDGINPAQEVKSRIVKGQDDARNRIGSLYIGKSEWLGAIKSRG